jgi:RNA polymerase sigma-70 factor (ECF subfamily)
MPLTAPLYTDAFPMDPAPAQSALQARALDRFLRGIERRALRIAELSTRDREDALELVQDAMLAFARSYADKPEADWAPLFHRVLDSRILDHHRRGQVRRRWRVWFGRDADEPGEDPLEQVADPAEPGPLLRLADGETRAALDAALRALPLRQRQCFLLRMWEGLDVAQTASAMRCSEGSVKTHLSRALAALRARLEDLR